MSMQHFLKTLIIFTGLTPFLSQAEPDLNAASSPLIRTASGQGWSAGAAVEFGRREFKVAGNLLETDLRRIQARVGFDLLSSLHPWVEVGTVQAEQDTLDGENGPEWAVGLELNLMEFVVEGHPSIPRKKLVRLGGEAAYRHSESNSSEADFDWSEVTLRPRVSYVVDHRGEGAPDYYPNGSATYLGLVYSGIDGNLGNADVEGNRNFGFELGGSLRFRNGVVTELSGIVFGDKDRQLRLGLAYHF